jgi:hypothetical protein
MGHLQRAEPFKSFGARCLARPELLFQDPLFPSIGSSKEKKKSTDTHLDGDIQTSDDAIAINHNITHRGLASAMTDFWVNYRIVSHRIAEIPPLLNPRRNVLRT